MSCFKRAQKTINNGKTPECCKEKSYTSQFLDKDLFLKEMKSLRDDGRENHNAFVACIDIFKEKIENRLSIAESNIDKHDSLISKLSEKYEELKDKDELR